jgi:predicted Zn-dependent protease
LQNYVNTLGNAVAKNSSRPQIPYYFVVVDSPVHCAFSCPGGIVFISKELMKGMADEAELACVLAHEVSHVSHKHALTSVKRAKFFEGAAKVGTLHMDRKEGQQYRDLVGNLQTVLFDKGLDKNMEFEADASAMKVAYRTGYDPNGMIRVLRMLKKKESAATKKGSWFSTHPPLLNRIDRCDALKKNYPDAKDMARVKNRFMRYQQRL